jgi:hypothetical protein
VVNAVTQLALQSGQLTAIARQKYSNAVIDSASARFQNNEFAVQANGKLVNECPLNVDLHFTDTRTVSLQFEGDSLVIHQNDDQSVVDLNNLPCLLTTIGLLGLAVIGGDVFAGLAGAAALGKFVGVTVGAVIGFLLTGVGPLAVSQLIDGSGGSQPSTVDLTEPIPGSDFLPTLSGGFFQISNGGMLIAAIAGNAPRRNQHDHLRPLRPARRAASSPPPPRRSRT